MAQAVLVILCEVLRQPLTAPWRELDRLGPRPVAIVVLDLAQSGPEEPSPFPVIRFLRESECDSDDDI